MLAAQAEEAAVDVAMEVPGADSLIRASPALEVGLEAADLPLESLSPQVSCQLLP